MFGFDCPFVHVCSQTTFDLPGVPHPIPKLWKLSITLSEHLAQLDKEAVNCAMIIYCSEPLGGKAVRDKCNILRAPLHHFLSVRAPSSVLYHHPASLLHPALIALKQTSCEFIEYIV